MLYIRPLQAELGTCTYMSNLVIKTVQKKNVDNLLESDVLIICNILFLRS